MIEYYHAGLDHYFITFAGGGHRGAGFRPVQRLGADRQDVQGYVVAAGRNEPGVPLLHSAGVGDSHFFSASPAECGDVLGEFPAFVYESPAVMYEFLPDVASGACPPNTTPIYRVWNQRADSNHRYTTDRALRDAMVAQGYVAEGYGPDAVVMCAPP